MSAARKRLVLLLALSCTAAAKPDKAAPPPAVELKPIGIPVVVDGKLVNYVLTTIRITLPIGADALKAQEKEPLLRDELVREASRHPFNVPGDRQRLDDARLKAAALAAARNILSTSVSGVQISAETPQRRYVEAPR